MTYYYVLLIILLSIFVTNSVFKKKIIKFTFTKILLGSTIIMIFVPAILKIAGSQVLGLFLIVSLFLTNIIVNIYIKNYKVIKEKERERAFVVREYDYNKKEIKGNTLLDKQKIRQFFRMLDDLFKNHANRIYTSISKVYYGKAYTKEENYIEQAFASVEEEVKSDVDILKRSAKNRKTLDRKNELEKSAKLKNDTVNVIFLQVQMYVNDGEFDKAKKCLKIIYLQAEDKFKIAQAYEILEAILKKERIENKENKI